MTDQLRISDDGELEVQPLTWDGEPLFSPESARELFDSAAFAQMRGQTTLNVGECFVCGTGEHDLDCSECAS